jgi:hypothetical protein
MKLKHILLVVVTCFFAISTSAQKFELEKLKAKASWGIGGVDRVVFESHSFDNIVRYDSFIPVLKQFLSDAQSADIVFDSLSSPVKMHYIISPSDRRKLTIENPEFIASGFDLDEEEKKLNDSLPGNVIHLYDNRYNIRLSIYLEQPKNGFKLGKIIDIWELRIATQSTVDIKDTADKNLIPSGDYSADQNRLNFDYQVFKEGMSATINSWHNQGLLVKKFRISSYSFQFNSFLYNGDTASVTQTSIGSGSASVEDLYSSVGFLGNNVCSQLGVRIPLSVKYKMDLPVKVFYLNVGTTLYSTMANNGSGMNIHGSYEGLLGYKSMNTSPDLRTVKDYRTSGFELGGFLSDRDGVLLPRAGLVLKTYKQMGNVRFTSGIYTGKAISGESPSIQSTLLFTIEVFDLF